MAPFEQEQQSGLFDDGMFEDSDDDNGRAY